MVPRRVEDQLDRPRLQPVENSGRIERLVHIALRKILLACLRGIRRGADGLVDARLDEVAEVVLARGLIVVEADLDVLGDLSFIKR